MARDSVEGTIGTTVSESVPWWPAQDSLSGPNVLLVIFDDTGWSDFGCFGSEINTPAIDALARGGLRYTNFHVTPLCSPTRACLLTGRNHHAVGMRFLADTDTGFPNSRGRVDPTVPMLPKLLRDRGYGSYLAGKWHLTPAHEITPAGPFEDWPIGRGFERFYGFLGGCTDQYFPELYRDNHQVDPFTDDGYHISVDIVDKALGYLSDHVSFRGERQFFLQLAFGATHAPFQAPRQYIEKYRDVFAKGWDRTREDRLARQVDLGLVPDGTLLTERNPGVSPWESCSAQERQLYTHLQTAFAGFLEHADEQLGRVMAGLERLGVAENTLVIVLSDNGASREGGTDGAVDVNAPYSGIHQSVEEQLAGLDRIGGRDGPAHYPEGWAMAGNTPFRRYKQYVDLGGVRSPLVVAWPKGIAARGEIRPQFAHAIDIAPTIMSTLGAHKDLAFDGQSIAHTFSDASAPAARKVQYWEMLGHRALWYEGWKAVTEHVPGTLFDEDTWRLYDTHSDFSEATNVASENPERLASLQSQWWHEAHANQVLPLDDRSLVELLIMRTPLALASRSRIVLRPNQAHVPATTLITGSDRPMRVTARLKGRSTGDEGVLLASGNASGGYVLYVQGNHLHFEHIALAQRVSCASTTPLPEGDYELGLSLARRGDRSGDVELFVGQTVVGRCKIPRTLFHLSFWGLDIGRDRASRVSRMYDGEFPFPPSVLERVLIEFSEGAPSEDIASEVEGVE